MSQLISQSHVMPQLSHATIDKSRATRSVTKRQRLIASLEDSPLMSTYTTFKPMLTSPSVPEIIPVSTALPIMGIALWCVWAVHAAESSKRTTCATDCTEMVTPAADTLETTTLATEIPEMATPATDSSEMVVNAMEIPEIAAQIRQRWLRSLQSVPRGWCKQWRSLKGPCSQQGVLRRQRMQQILWGGLRTLQLLSRW